MSVVHLVYHQDRPIGTMINPAPFEDKDNHTQDRSVGFDHPLSPRAIFPSITKHRTATSIEHPSLVHDRPREWAINSRNTRTFVPILPPLRLKGHVCRSRRDCQQVDRRFWTIYIHSKTSYPPIFPQLNISVKLTNKPISNNTTI
jgi:hypothetical protein